MGNRQYESHECKNLKCIQAYSILNKDWVKKYEDLDEKTVWLHQYRKLEHQFDLAENEARSERRAYNLLDERFTEYKRDQDKMMIAVSTTNEQFNKKMREDLNAKHEIELNGCKQEITELNKVIDDLKTQIIYQPGGSGFKEANQDFSSRLPGFVQ